jgi:hypothetical protein
MGSVQQRSARARDEGNSREDKAHGASSTPPPRRDDESRPGCSAREIMSMSWTGPIVSVGEECKFR